jgi:hypothetical protein
MAAKFTLNGKRRGFLQDRISKREGQDMFGGGIARGGRHRVELH